MTEGDNLETERPSLVLPSARELELVLFMLTHNAFAVCAVIPGWDLELVLN